MFIGLSNCSDNSTEISSNDSDAIIDPIIGTWRFNKIRILFNNGSERSGGILDYCEKKDTYKFFLDKSLEFTDYGAGYSDDECRDNPYTGEYNPNGKWKNSGDGKYIFNRTYNNGETESQSRVIEFKEKSEMFWVFDYRDEDVFDEYNGENLKIDFEYYEFIKVE